MGRLVPFACVFFFTLQGSWSQRVEESCRHSGLDLGSGADDHDSVENHLSVLQKGANRKSDRSLMTQRYMHNDVDSCQELTNQGSYFTMEVEVGTPKQKFNLIPDTGSNAMVIPGCKCVESGRCGSLRDCFMTNNSTSFKKIDPEDLVKMNESNMTHVISGSMDGDEEPQPYAVITYGSGPIACSIGSDTVTLGKVSTTLNDGVFMMESRTLLQAHDTFEGIFGLGLPNASMDSNASLAEPLFMQAAKVDRYSMCYNDGGTAGVLRMDVPKLKKPMGNIGKAHWGLDLQGMSVGKDTSEVLFCGPDEKKEGMQTACGAIPDSGTTMIAGPASQISKLFESICDNWSRCSEAAKKLEETKIPDQETMPLPMMQMPMTKSFVFLKLLSECGKWLKEDGDINEELPPLTMHLAGLSGEKQEVELSPWSYIVETDRPKLKMVHKKLFGPFGIDVVVPDPNETEKTCTPAFQNTDYITQSNGPVWILGNALFYDKIVSYDISASPPAISIEEGECEPCKASRETVESPESLLASSSGKKRRALRRLGEVRDSNIDITKPL